MSIKELINLQSFAADGYARAAKHRDAFAATGEPRHAIYALYAAKTAAFLSRRVRQELGIE